MTLWAIIPVKPLKRGKSRLASILSETERTTLNQTMLVNTLKILTKLPEIEKILVVSRDPAALSIAREWNARTVLEDGNPELNTALRRAAKVAQAYHANEILVLPADLPLMKEETIRNFLGNSSNPPELIIAPDRRKDGTNALYISPADLIDFYYGPGSFDLHINAAKKTNAEITIVENEELGLDLDLPEDLVVLNEIENRIKQST